jgi:hypothetical protein
MDMVNAAVVENWRVLSDGGVVRAARAIFRDEAEADDVMQQA